MREFSLVWETEWEVQEAIVWRTLRGGATTDLEFRDYRVKWSQKRTESLKE